MWKSIAEFKKSKKKNIFRNGPYLISYSILMLFLIDFILAVVTLAHVKFS